MNPGRLGDRWATTPARLVLLNRLTAVDDHGVTDGKEAASEHSQRTASAISSGVPMRPMGSSEITLARPSAVPPVKRAIIGVSMYPGQMALMRTFCAA